MELEIEAKKADVQGAYDLGLHLASGKGLSEEFFKQAVTCIPQPARIQNSFVRFLFAEKRYHAAVVHLSNARKAYEGLPQGIDNA
jgi:Tfp pilus assembly protein PilF